MDSSCSQDYVALQDLTDNLHKCMLIKKGDRVKVLDKSDPLWVVQSPDHTRRGTVPKNILTREEDLQEPWFCVGIDEDQAINALILLEEGQGAFLIIPTKEFYFTLYVRDGNEVKKFKIKKNQQGKMGLKNKKEFPSLVALVSHYHQDADDLGVELRKAVDTDKVISLIEENIRRMNQWQPSNKPKETVIKQSLQSENKPESKSEAEAVVPSGKTKSKNLHLNTGGGAVYKKLHHEGNSLIAGISEWYSSPPGNSLPPSSAKVINSASPPEKEKHLGPGDYSVKTRGGTAIMSHVVGNNSIMVDEITPSVLDSVDTLISCGEKLESARPALPRPKLEESAMDSDDDTIYHIDTEGGTFINKEVIKGNGYILHTRKRNDDETSPSTSPSTSP